MQFTCCDGLLHNPDTLKPSSGDECSKTVPNLVCGRGKAKTAEVVRNPSSFHFCEVLMFKRLRTGLLVFGMEYPTEELRKILASIRVFAKISDDFRSSKVDFLHDLN